MGAVKKTFKRAGRFLSGASSKPPPVLTGLPDKDQIANRIKPIDFVNVFNSVNGDRFEIRRGLDGQINLGFSNSTGNNGLDAPIAIRNVNTSLPPVRRVRARDVNEEAASVAVLSQALTRLNNTIETIENTHPYLIEQNKDLINSFRTASQQALEKGFDIKQNGIDKKLAQIGLANSSTAIGTQIALARQKADSYAANELKQAELAQSLKQQAITNLHTRGNSIAKNADIEQNKFGAETGVQLKIREQDLNNEFGIQKLEQQQAQAKVSFDLQAAELDLNAQIANNQKTTTMRNQILQMGNDMFNTGNTNAINSKSIDNTAVNNLNSNTSERYKTMPENPWRTASRNFLVKGVTRGVSN